MTLNKDSLKAVIKIINGQFSDDPKHNMDRLELISEVMAYCRQEIYQNNLMYLKMTAARKERKEIERKLKGK